MAKDTGKSSGCRPHHYQTCKEIPGSPFTILAGGHPIPDAQPGSRSKNARIPFHARPNDLLFSLISGGGSALPGCALGTAGSAVPHRRLLADGRRRAKSTSCAAAWIRSKVAGWCTYPTGPFSLIPSDVVGNPLEAITIRPDRPRPGYACRCLALLDNYGLRSKLPPSIPAMLERVETLRAGQSPPHKGAECAIVGSGLLAAQAALAQAPH